MEQGLAVEAFDPVPNAVDTMNLNLVHDNNLEHVAALPDLKPVMDLLVDYNDGPGSASHYPSSQPPILIDPNAAPEATPDLVTVKNPLSPVCATVVTPHPTAAPNVPCQCPKPRRRQRTPTSPEATILYAESLAPALAGRKWTTRPRAKEGKRGKKEGGRFERKGVEGGSAARGGVFGKARSRWQDLTYIWRLFLCVL